MDVTEEDRRDSSRSTWDVNVSNICPSATTVRVYIMNNWNKQVHVTQEIQMILVSKYGKTCSRTERGGDIDSNSTYASVRHTALFAFSSGLSLGRMLIRRLKPLYGRNKETGSIDVRLPEIVKSYES